MFYRQAVKQGDVSGGLPDYTLYYGQSCQSQVFTSDGMCRPQLQGNAHAHPHPCTAPPEGVLHWDPVQIDQYPFCFPSRSFCFCCKWQNLDALSSKRPADTSDLPKRNQAGWKNPCLCRHRGVQKFQMNSAPDFLILVCSGNCCVTRSLPNLPLYVLSI